MAPDGPEVPLRGALFVAPQGAGEENRFTLGPETCEATIHVLAHRAVTAADVGLAVTPPARRTDVVATRRGALARILPEPGARSAVRVRAQGRDLAGLLVRALPARETCARRMEIVATPLGALAGRLSQPAADMTGVDDIAAAMAEGEEDEAARMLSRSLAPHLADRPALAAHASAVLAAFADAQADLPQSLGPLLMLMARDQE